MVVVASELVSRRLQLDRMLSSCLVKYRTSEWSIPAILSSVVWASGPTNVVATFAPFMMGESGESGESDVWVRGRVAQRAVWSRDDLNYSLTVRGRASEI